MDRFPGLLEQLFEDRTSEGSYVHLASDGEGDGAERLAWLIGASSRVLLASVNRMLGWVSNRRSSRNALSTDSMGYCGGGPYLDAASVSVDCMPDIVPSMGGGVCVLLSASFTTQRSSEPVRVSMPFAC